jgi:protein gp37
LQSIFLVNEGELQFTVNKKIEESRVNKTNRMFDVITANWSPVKGCLHNCTYCWAKRYADRLKQAGSPKYADGFGPKLCEEELSKRFHKQFVFVTDMGDLFGKWVPSEWILKVIEAIKQSPTSHFLFLTKNPIRYFEFYKLFPKNIVLGVTIETNRDYPGITKAPSFVNRRMLNDVPWKHKLVSIEPIMEFDSEALEQAIESIKPTIVYIGYDNYNNKLPEPSSRKVLSLIEDLQTFTKVKVQPTKRNHEMGLI